MRIKEFNQLETTLKQANQNNQDSTLPAIILLLEDVKEILFPDGKYKKLHWLQWRRLWKLAKATIKLINTLMGIFKGKTVVDLSKHK